MPIPSERFAELLLHFEPFLLWTFARVGGSRENEASAWDYREQNSSLTNEEIGWIVERLVARKLIKYGFAFSIIGSDSYYCSRDEGELAIQLTEAGMTEAERLIRERH